MRVSTYSQSQALLRQIQQTQVRQSDDQRQVSTGRKADDYAGLGRDAAAVLSAHSLVRRAESYGQITTELNSRLTLQDTNLGAIGDSVTNLVNTLRAAVSTGNGAGIMDAVQATYGTAAQALNADFGGQYMFGGTRTDAQPFTATSFADLSDPAKPLSSFFADTGSLQSVAVADGMVIKPGVRASDAGQDVMAALKAIGEYDASSGPLTGTLTDAQRTFLNQQISALSTAVTGITGLRAVNGAQQKQIEVLQGQHKDALANAEALLDDMENVDPAEAITRLNQDETSLQALYKMVDQLNKLSLLDFL